MPERQRRESYQPGPTAQGKIAIRTGGLKARFNSKGECISGPGLQPLASIATMSWAVGPGWYGDGPLALQGTPPESRSTLAPRLQFVTIIIRKEPPRARVLRSKCCLASWEVSNMGYIPNITVHRHPKESKYIFMRFAPWKDHDGFSLAWGPVLHITASEMQVRGLEICLEDLQNYSTREGTDGFQTGEEKALVSYPHVSISLQPGPVLDVEPTSACLRPSDPSYRVTVPLPCSNETFFHIVNDVLDKCYIPKMKKGGR